MSLQYSVVLLTFQEMISYHYKIWFITSWCELRGLLAELDHSHHCDHAAQGWTKKFWDIPSEHDWSKSLRCASPSAGIYCSSCSSN